MSFRNMPGPVDQGFIPRTSETLDSVPSSAAMPTTPIPTSIATQLPLGLAIRKLPAELRESIFWPNLIWDGISVPPLLRALKYDPLYEELVAIFQRANPVFTLSYKNNWSFAFLAPDLLACIEAVEVVLTDYLYDPHCHPIFRNLTIDQHPLPSFLHPILTALPHLTHIRLTPSAGTNGANFIHFWLKNLVGLRTLKRVNVVMPQLQQDMGEVDDGMGWKGRSWVLEEDMREIAERHMKVKADGLLGADGRLEVGGEGEMARRIWVWEVEEGMVLRELSLEVMEMTYNP